MKNEFYVSLPFTIPIQITKGNSLHFLIPIWMKIKIQIWIK